MTKKINKKTNQRFFSFSWTKLTWSVILGIIAYAFILWFMRAYSLQDLMGQASAYFFVAYSWIFFMISNLLLMFLSSFLRIDNPTPFVENLVIYGPLIINLIWDYFLVCLAIFIYKKFKGDKK
jgi:hypothetical protein